MYRILLNTLLVALCVLLPLCQSAPVMSYFNVSNKPIQPRIPEAKKIIPLPYREPAPVYEVQEEDNEIQHGDYETRNYIGPKNYNEPRNYNGPRNYNVRPTRPIKYGFVNPKTRFYDPRVAYNYNKRFIYTNLVY